MQGPIPAGFAIDRIEAAAGSLLQKRARSVARIWPALAAEMGESFQSHFLAYARLHPIPASGPLTDGRHFLDYLRREGSLPDLGRLLALQVDLHHRLRDSHSPRRRRFFVGWTTLRKPRRLVIGVKLPGLAPRSLAMPWPW